MASVKKIVFNDNMKLKPGGKNKDYLCFSNHYVAEMFIDGKQYNHIEGYYHSSKYLGINEKVAERIRSVIFPGLCKKICNENPLIDEQIEKWNTTRRILVMKRALYTKFITSGELAKCLISTRDAKLVYYNSSDNYWGTAEDEKGENILGRLLEEVRDTLTSLSVLEDDIDSDTDNNK